MVSFKLETSIPSGTLNFKLGYWLFVQLAILISACLMFEKFIVTSFLLFAASEKCRTILKLVFIPASLKTFMSTSGLLSGEHLTIC